MDKFDSFAFNMITCGCSRDSLESDGIYKAMYCDDCWKTIEHNNKKCTCCDVSYIEERLFVYRDKKDKIHCFECFCRPDEYYDSFRKILLTTFGYKKKRKYTTDMWYA